MFLAALYIKSKKMTGFKCLITGLGSKLWIMIIMKYCEAPKVSCRNNWWQHMPKMTGKGKGHDAKITSSKQ